MTAPVRAPELAGRGGWTGTDKPLTLAGLRGRVVVLFFWSASDAACLRVVEELRRLDHLYAEELVVVGVHSARFPHEADHQAVARAVVRHRIAHPVIDDPEGATAASYGVRCQPALVLVGPDGAVRTGWTGEGHGPALGRAVADLLEADRRRRRPLLFPPSGPVPEPLAFPAKVAASPDGERLAIADTGHDRVLVTTLDGLVLAAYTGYVQPHGVRFDGRGVVICDTVPGRIVRSNGEVLADGIPFPWDLVRDADGSWVVAEAAGHRLVRARPGEIAVRVAAGTGAQGGVDGPDLQCELDQPSGVALTADGLAFVDAGTSTLRRLRRDRRGGEVTTLAGEGLQHPRGVAASPDGGPVYVADTYNSRLLSWDGRSMTALPVTGLDEPGGLDLLPDGRLVVADTNHHRVVLVDPTTGAVTPVVVDETWAHAADGGPLTAAPGQVVRVPAGIELVDEQPRGPVWACVEARPPLLLAGGPQQVELAATTGTVQARAGRTGRGLLLVEVVTVVGPDGTERVHRSRHRFEVTG